METLAISSYGSIEQFFKEDEIRERERAAKERFIHEDGIKEGRRQVVSEIADMSYAEVDIAKFAADLFVDIVKDHGIPVKIHQARAGIDPTSGIPTAFLMVSKGDTEMRKKLIDLSRTIEKAVWSTMRKTVTVWAYDKTGYDRTMVEADFPYFRIQN